MILIVKLLVVFLALLAGVLALPSAILILPSLVLWALSSLILNWGINTFSDNIKVSHGEPERKNDKS